MEHQDKIAIVGYGVEGKAMCQYLLAHSYGNITVLDQKTDLPGELPEGVSSSLGPDYLEGVEEFDIIFRSPGVKYLDPHIQMAKNAGKQVTSALDFFVDQCPCPIVGVTGTKGKGTTCTLIYEMLKAGGRKAGVDLFLGGNIGNPPMEFLDQLNADCVVILELSSFQLQDIRKSPRYSVMLNTTEDHLDYHVDRDEYMMAKEQLLVHQHADNVAVLNQDYEYFKYYKPLVKGSLRTVSTKGRVENGAYVHQGGIFYIENGKTHNLAAVGEMKLIGAHNLENILPAVVIARELGVGEEAIAGVIRTFENLPHRLQFARELNGVRYFNDSYSTTPETSMAAVDSFDCDTILIAGGSDKGADYSEWAEKILTKPSLKTVILIGQTADKMEKALMEAEERLVAAGGGDAASGSGLAGGVLEPTRILRRDNLEQAVIEAYSDAEDGSVVVMSPAAASFDQFKDYKERGNTFIAHARKLK